MKRFWEYLVLFVALLLLQVLLFDNLNLTIYVTPLVYVAFFALLPLQTPRLVFLLAGLAMGVATDFLMGTSGINTIACLVTGYLRPWIASATLGKDAEREGETPLPRLHGTARWLRYAAALVTVHCVLFFLSEAMSLHGILFTLARAFCSAAATILVVWFIAALYPVRK